MKLKRLSCILSVLILVFNTGNAYAAINITNAFSSDATETMQSYKESYGWDDDLLIQRTWRVRVPGEGNVAFHRLTGYQDYYLSDNILSTRTFLGLTDGIYQSEINVVAPKSSTMISVARKELKASDNKETPKGSNIVKYNTWFGGETYAKSWSATFISYCADACDYIDGNRGKFLKTSSIQNQYNHLSKRFPVYEIITTSPFGGKTYSPMVGDIIFLTDKNDSFEFTRMGIISSVTPNGIYVIEGDSDNSVKKNLYSKSDIEAFKNSVIVHVVY